jgi:hypothetical protein
MPPPVGTLSDLGEHPKTGPAIPIPPIDLLTAIAAGADAVRGAAESDAQGASRARDRLRSKQNTRPDPTLFPILVFFSKLLLASRIT